MTEQTEGGQAEWESRESPLSVAQKWLPWCLALIFVTTIGWTALVSWEEVSNGGHTSLRETVIAVVDKAAPAVPFIVIYAIMATSLIDALGGFALVTKRWLEENWLNPWLERRKTEGHAEGRVEEWLLWSEWNHRRMEAEERGVPFNELPPSKPSGRTRNGDQTLA